MEDLRNIRNFRAMKQILVEKFNNEKCGFTYSDISITRKGNGYDIIISEYEHIPFRMTFDYDEYFGYIVYIDDIMEDANVVFVDSKKEYDIRTALIRLGYIIANTF